MGDESTHKNVKNAFFTMYINNRDLERKLGIDYNEVKRIAQDLMQERKKRSKYQYHVGESAIKNDAKISLDRASNFFEKCRERCNQ